MGIIDARLPRWANAAHTAIDMTITHSEYGDIPFTASANDNEPHGVALFNEASLGLLGAVAPYVESPAVAAAAAAAAQALAEKNEARGDALIALLATKTPAQAADYINANVTNLTQAKAVLASFAKVLVILSKRI